MDICEECSNKKKRQICARAATYGHLSCLIYAREMGCHWNVNTCILAAKNGHLSCLIWARENGCAWNSGVPYAAVKNGHLDCLIWARENGCPWEPIVTTIATRFGHLNCLSWALDHGCEMREKIAKTAAMFGKIDVLEYLYFIKGTTFPIDICKSACDLNVIKWLFHKNYSLHSYCYSRIMGIGNPEDLEWLFCNNCPWDSRSCIYAATTGKLDNIIWAHSKNLTLHEDICTAAAGHNQLHILKWAIMNNCPFDQRSKPLFFDNIYTINESYERVFANIITEKIISRVNAAVKIQNKWLQLYYTPGNSIWSKRMKRQFTNLQCYC